MRPTRCLQSALLAKVADSHDVVGGVLRVLLKLLLTLKLKMLLAKSSLVNHTDYQSMIEKPTFGSVFLCLSSRKTLKPGI